MGAEAAVVNVVKAAAVAAKAVSLERAARRLAAKPRMRRKPSRSRAKPETDGNSARDGRIGAAMGARRDAPNSVVRVKLKPPAIRKRAPCATASAVSVVIAGASVAVKPGQRPPTKTH